MVSIEAYSELLRVLYSASLHPEQWQRFLTLLCEHTRSPSAFFISAESRSGLKVLAEGGEPPGQASMVRVYNETYARSDPFRAPLIRKARYDGAIGVFSDEDLLPHAGLLGTELYRDVLSQSDFRHLTVTVLTLSVRRIEAISIWRTADAGPMDADSKRLLNRLIPHLQTALEVRRALRAGDQQRAGAEAMANASSAAIFVLSVDGNIRHANSAAKALLRSGEGFVATHGRLVAFDSQANEALIRVMREVASPVFSLAGGPPRRFLAVRRQEGKRPFQLLATVLPKTHRSWSDADLLVMITDPENAADFPDEALRSLYELTSAETEVANGLLMGYSLLEIAALRKVSVGTIRQQVKSMLNKTGTRRQVDMMRLFSMIPQISIPTD